MNLLWSRSQETEAYIDHMNDKSYCLTTNTDAEYCVSFFVRAIKKVHDIQIRPVLLHIFFFCNKSNTTGPLYVIF